jgi:hypothetical protein
MRTSLWLVHIVVEAVGSMLALSNLLTGPRRSTLQINPTSFFVTVIWHCSMKPKICVGSDMEQ